MFWKRRLPERSEAEHVVEAEAVGAANEAVIAEQPAGQVANQHIGAGPGRLELPGAERLGDAEEVGAAAGDGAAPAGRFDAFGVTQTQPIRALGVPRQ